jgi:serine/threonine protein kinase
LAAAANDEALNIAGTPGHIAPEVTWQKTKYGVSSDLWAVSLVIFYTFFIPIAKTKKEFKNFKIESDPKFKLKITKNSKKEEIEKQVSEMISRMQTLWESTSYKYKDTYWKWMMECLKIDPKERPKAKDLFNEGIQILKLENPEKYDKLSKEQNMTEQINLQSFLASVQCEKYLNNFTSNGYEDFNSILKLEASDFKDIQIESEEDISKILESLKLNHPSPQENNLELDFFDVPSWLKSIGLSIYTESFMNVGFDDIEYIWENGLTEIEIKSVLGIQKIGHWKWLQNSIKQLQRLLMKNENDFYINLE